MLLEQIAPATALGRADSCWLPVPPGSVFAELQKIMPAEIPLVRVGLKLAWPIGNAFGGRLATAWLAALDARLTPKPSGPSA